jgi:hypothetical protein
MLANSHKSTNDRRSRAASSFGAPFTQSLRANCRPLEPVVQCRQLPFAGQ